MLQLYSLACVVSYCVVATFVGIRLGRLAVRTGESPERFVGAALLFGGAVGYPMTIIAGALDEPPEVVLRLVVLGTIGLHISAWCNVQVWQSVFHRDSAVARGIAIVLTAALVASCVDTITNHATWMSRVFRPSSMATQVSDLMIQATAYLLTATSAFRYAAMMRRRAALGLGDPVVANRLRLWGWVSAIVVVQFAIAIGTLLTFGSTSASHPACSLAIASLGLVLATLLYLAFLPPGAYKRWIERRGARVTASGS